MNKLQMVKFMVAVMTFLLIFGTLSVLGILYKQFRKAPEIPVAKTMLSLQQPAGSRIEQIIVKNGQLHILLKEGGKSDRILVLSPDNQNIVQEIVLN